MLAFLPMVLADATTQAAAMAPAMDLKPLGLAGILIGSGIIVAGAAKGIGNIGGNAVEAIARQPEAKGSIGTNMLLASALIEGFTFFALIIAFIAMGK